MVGDKVAVRKKVGDTASATSIIIVVSDTLAAGGRVYGGNVAMVAVEYIAMEVGECSGEVTVVETNDRDTCKGTAVSAGVVVGMLL